MNVQMNNKTVSTIDLVAPELYSVTMGLKPRDTGGISAVKGSHIYAAIFKILRASSPGMAEELHDMDEQKPFTISLLRRKTLKSKEPEDKTNCVIYSLRLTFLQGLFFAHFINSALSWGNNDVQIGTANFKIEQIDTFSKDSTIPSFTKYTDILNNASNEHKIHLEFVSPTVFRSGGKRNVVFPEPQLVFGSLLNRWQAYSRIKFDDSISSWIEKILTIRYRLTTRMLDFGTYQELGFTGYCQYEIYKDTPKDVVLALNALGDFAYYAGIGAKTTMGMGQSRRLLKV